MRFSLKWQKIHQIEIFSKKEHWIKIQVLILRAGGKKNNLMNRLKSKHSNMQNQHERMTVKAKVRWDTSSCWGERAVNMFVNSEGVMG